LIDSVGYFAALQRQDLYADYGWSVHGNIMASPVR